MPHTPTEPPTPSGPADREDRDDVADALVPAVRTTLSRLRFEPGRRERLAHPADRAGSGSPASGSMTRQGEGDGAGLTAGPDGSDPLVGLLAQLRAIVTRYASGARARGVPPERMLASLKELAQEGMGAEQWHDPATARLLTALMVRWSISAYYDQ